MPKRRSPGEGSVVPYRGARGLSWRIKYVDENGAQRMETVGRERDGVTRTVALEALAEKLVDVRKRRKNGRHRAAEIPGFREYADAWLERVAASRSLRRSSWLAYRGSLDRLAALLAETPLTAIRRQHARAYEVFARTLPHARGRGEGLSNRTIGYDLGRLRDVLEAAVDDELLEANPIAGVKHPKVAERAWRILRPEEVGPLYRSFADPLAALIFLVAITTGLRRMELLNLRWRAVHLTDPDGPFLHVEESKSKAGIRDVALSPAVADALFEHRGASAYGGDDDYVFAHATKGSRVRAQWYAERFREALEAAGMGDQEIRPFHDLRHSAVTALALEATNAFVLQQVAGHANIATTQGYVRLAGRRFPDEASALERRYGLALAGDK